MGNETSSDARYVKGDRIELNNGNKGYIHIVGSRKDDLTGNVEYRYGVEMDKKQKNGHNGKDKFQCKAGHGLFMNETDIKRKLNYNGNMNNNTNNKSQHHHHHEHKQQQQMQIQENIKDNIKEKVLINTQELLDQTNQEIDLIKDYLQCLMNNKNDKNLSNKKQKVKVGLRLYEMNVSSMYEDQIKNKFENYSDAFKQAQVLIYNFQQNVDKSTQNMNIKMKQELICRLEPLLNYMYACLQGMDDDKLPDLPSVLDYKFNQEIANRVLSGLVKAQNHDYPDRRNDIKNNLKQYETEQNELLKESNNINFPKAHNINVNNITKDINRRMGYGPTSKQIKQQFEKDKREQYTHKAPDLTDGF